MPGHGQANRHCSAAGEKRGAGASGKSSACDLAHDVEQLAAQVCEGGDAYRNRPGVGPVLGAARRGAFGEDDPGTRRGAGTRKPREIVEAFARLAGEFLSSDDDDPAAVAQCGFSVAPDAVIRRKVTRGEDLGLLTRALPQPFRSLVALAAPGASDHANEPVDGGRSGELPVDVVVRGRAGPAGGCAV